MKTFKKDMEINDEEVDRILEEGINCCAEVEVGEIVHCLMTMFEHIHEAQMVKIVKEKLGPEHNEVVDKLLICVFMSEIATITANFKNREEKGAEA